MVAFEANATLLLRVATTGSGGMGGFISIGMEKSYRSNAEAAIGCRGACICAPQTYSAHTVKRYTYLQRTPPKWLYWPSPPAVTQDMAKGDESSPILRDGSDSCLVEVRLITSISNGSRPLFVKAFTFSPPRAGNKSVSVASLYSLP
jgi:hypothetical protein